MMSNETFIPYEPLKEFRRFPHPGKVVQTKALSFAELPILNYKHSLPKDCVDPKSNFSTLSGVQLESVCYAGQAHSIVMKNKKRQGFIIADGAGLGKGRAAAGIIADNFFLGRRKSVWVSASKDLIYDATRDMKDVLNNHDEICIMGLTRSYDPIKLVKGVLFITYSSLGSSSTLDRGANISGFNSRYDQIKSWMGKSFNGVIIFDESHKAKNYKANTQEKSSRAGQQVANLQHDFPDARVVYLSATLASEISDLMYMDRVGLWGSDNFFKSATDFLDVINRRGLAARELISLELKRRGLLMCRHLSLEDVIFESKIVECDPLDVRLYNKCTRLWKLMLDFIDEEMDIDHFSLDPKDLFKKRAKLKGLYWAQHQSFFRSLCVGFKVSGAIEIARNAALDGKAVVIGLQSTGEAAFKNFRTHAFDAEGKFSKAGVLLQTFLMEKLKLTAVDLGLDHFEKRMLKLYGKRKAPDPRQEVLPKMKIRKQSRSDDSLSKNVWNAAFSGGTAKNTLEPESDSETSEFGSARENICHMFKEIVKKLNERFGNPLDVIKMALGGDACVSEMTGRNYIPVFKDDKLMVERRFPEKNQLEQNRFNDGETNYAIISDACSTGISLHSNDTFINKKPRFHIILEIPLSANVAVQQMGRTNRSNQIHRPEYVLLISKVPGELRFASAVASRIQNLGAISKGDSRSETSSAWNYYLLNSKYGPSAITKLVNSVENEDELNYFAESEQEEQKLIASALESVGVIKENGTINPYTLKLEKFLNRVLGVELSIQETILELLQTALENCETEDKENETFDTGIEELDLVLPGKQSLVAWKNYKLKKHKEVNVCELACDSSISWPELTTTSELQFFSTHAKQSKHSEVIAALVKPLEDSTRFTYEVYSPFWAKPKTRTQSFMERNNFKQISQGDAEKLWKRTLTNLSSGAFLHVNMRFRFGKCRDKKCLHEKTLHRCKIIVDDCLSLWDHIAPLLPNEHVRVVRAHVNKAIVGVFVPSASFTGVSNVLHEM